MATAIENLVWLVNRIPAVQRQRLSGNWNRERNLLHIHIPKCAGTSVASALGMKRSSHRTYVEYQAVLGERINELFTFAFVRNPWDRFLSLYAYARMEESYYHSAIRPQDFEYGKHLDHEILKSATLDQCCQLLEKGLLRHDERWNHWNPQVTWLYNPQRNVDISYIGRFETLERDFKSICSLQGFFPALPRLNQSRVDRGYRRFFTDYSRDFVARYYRADIDYFGYEF